MNKNDLIKQICENTGNLKIDVERIVNQTFEIIKESVMNGKKITISGFGNFRSVERKERNAHNFKTGETIKVPAKNVPKFKPSDDFIKRLNI